MTRLLPRLLVGVPFVLASLLKLTQPVEDFALAISGYQLVPPGLVTFIAVVLPFVELVCGIALVTGVLVESAAAALGLLSGTFGAAIVSAQIRGLAVGCGCFGPLSQRVGWPHLLLNVGLLVGCIWALRSCSKNGSEGDHRDTML